MNENPYAPPTVQNVHASNDLKEHALWQDGDLLVVGNGAILPNTCFASGLPAQVKFDWKTGYAPKWMPLLFLLGILPYFIIGPFFIRAIRIEVPLLHQHRNRIKRRSRVITWLYVSSVAMLILSTSELSENLMLLPFFGGLLTAFTAMTLSKGADYLGLRIVRCTADHIWLAGVHPNVLNQLPALS